MEKTFTGYFWSDYSPENVEALRAFSAALASEQTELKIQLVGKPNLNRVSLVLSNYEYLIEDDAIDDQTILVVKRRLDLANKHCTDYEPVLIYLWFDGDNNYGYSVKSVYDLVTTEKMAQK